MKYKSKADLLAQLVSERDAFLTLLAAIPEPRWTESGVWGDNWTVADLVAHLHEWHVLFIGWVRDGERGADPQLPAPGYKWNETPRLNRDIWAKHRDRVAGSVLSDFTWSADEAESLLRGLSEAEIFEPGCLPWAGKNALVTYAGANTVSHYRFARQILRRWLRNA